MLTLLPPGKELSENFVTFNFVCVHVFQIPIIYGCNFTIINTKSNIYKICIKNL